MPLNRGNSSRRCWLIGSNLLRRFSANLENRLRIVLQARFSVTIDMEASWDYSASTVSSGRVLHGELFPRKKFFQNRLCVTIVPKELKNCNHEFESVWQARTLSSLFEVSKLFTLLQAFWGKKLQLRISNSFRLIRSFEIIQGNASAREAFWSENTTIAKLSTLLYQHLLVITAID